MDKPEPTVGAVFAGRPEALAVYERRAPFGPLRQRAYNGLLVETLDAVDAELIGWLEEAYAVGLE